MSKNRVLVLIPAYNPDPKELYASIASIESQTIPADVYVIDDGSRQPIADHVSKNVTVVRLAKNGGITAALRAGVEYGLEQRYEFFCRLDVGDLSFPHRVEKQLAYMDAHPDVDLLGAFSQVVDLEDNHIGFHGIEGGPDAVHSYLRKNAAFKHSTFFMRASRLHETGNYDLSFCGAEDYELAKRISSRGKVDCLNEVLIKYIDDPKGISTRRRNTQLRTRLKAQFRYLELLSLGWYSGVVRTLVLMLMPHPIAKKLSILRWRSSTRH